MKSRQLKFSIAVQSLPFKGQRGFVLVIALIVLAAMTLAAAAMVRTIDTSTMLARNISFKRDALNRGDVALEAAINEFRTGGTYVGGANTEGLPADQARDAGLNFSAVMLATDTDGVPLVLKGNTDATFGTSPTWSKGEVDVASIPNSYDLGMRQVYLIERMCTATGPALADTCIVNGRAQAGGTQPNDKPGQLFPPMFRITARVVGPRNTVAYVQAIFSFVIT